MGGLLALSTSLWGMYIVNRPSCYNLFQTGTAKLPKIVVVWLRG